MEVQLCSTELRIYHCAPKKLPDLVNRFEKYTLPLWQKHGIKQAGFWTVYIGPSNHDLYYMLQWESLEERQKKWDAFMSDPESIEKRAKTEEPARSSLPREHDPHTDGVSAVK